MNQTELIGALGLVLIIVGALILLFLKLAQSRKLKKGLDGLQIDSESEIKNSTRATKVLQTASWILDPCSDCGSAFCHIQKVDDAGLWTRCAKCDHTPSQPLHIQITENGNERAFSEIFAQHLDFMKTVQSSNSPKLERILSRSFVWADPAHPQRAIRLKAFGNNVTKILRKKGLI